AGDAPADSAGEAALAPSDALDPAWDEAPAPGQAEADLEGAAPTWWTRAAGRGRIWMGAGAGVAFATLAVILVLARGGSSAAHRPPAIARPPEQAPQPAPQQAPPLGIVQQVERAAAKPPE